MIRDPSDGSVKSAPLRKTPQNNAERLPSSDAARGGVDAISGLPFSSTKPENVKRLEKSKRQLENYHKTGVWDDAT